MPPNCTPVRPSCAPTATASTPPPDIARIAAAVEEGTIALGGRRFTGTVPARSGFGNTVSRWFFRLLTGVGIHDTQTGLRGYPASLVPWLLSLPGDRFEYEFTMLLRSREAGVRIRELPIETIYLAENASSHFRPLQDSARIYAPALAFAASSLLGWAVDVAALFALVAVTGNLLGSIVGARVISATVNFFVNRSVVFGHDGPLWQAVVRYVGLALVILGINAAALMALVGTGWALLPAKLAVELALAVLSYVVQHRVVFARTPAPAAVGVQKALVDA